MTGTRLLIVVIAALVAGAGAGISGTMLTVDVISKRSPADSVKDQQIAALTAALDQLRLQLAADKAELAAEDRRIKALNAPPLHIAPPQTFQGGFQ